MQLYSKSIGLPLPGQSDLLPGQRGLSWSLTERANTGFPASATSPSETLIRSLILWNSFTVAFHHGRPKVSLARENSV